MPFRRNYFQRRMITADAQTDAVKRRRHRCLFAAMTPLDISDIVIVAGRPAGNDEVKTADFFSFDRERMTPRQRRHSRAIDQAPSLLADRSSMDAIRHA